ncbi:Npt1/Npt2 family nucleotide transporter [Aquimarina intermedia]|uniref:ADP,ATP carrier protein n=1 Tax=Aquimarina intermedia TaxID=350814 RepID=A0A5S5C6T4_9FLAO|nr:Npt1/Npt2 family nucleotide transporter [Aquimarina intermedia]TYP75064.1 AAA family ATP:ADP antiporter [Aquimarina intermedia]
MIRSAFKKIFDIRDGEIYISFLMQFYIFLVITVLLIVKPTINALFLSTLGADQLPYGYILVAVTAIVSSYFYNRAIQLFSIKRIVISTLLVFSTFFLVLSFLLHLAILNIWILYFYYLSVSLFAVLVTSQFWILANMVFNAREAKRLFGFIGSGAIAGGIFGGYLTTIIASTYGNKIAIAVAGILILCCIPILNSVWRFRIKRLNFYQRKQRKTREYENYTSSFRIILSSDHLKYLALITGVGVIVAKLVDFQFSDFANSAIPDSDDLASFFGFWFSTFNVIALLIQLFLTNRLLSFFGVTSTLLILPLGIALGCLLFLTFPELWVLIIIKGMDGSFKQSINKASLELSILPIPYQIKNQAKSYIDVVVDSLATGISGFLLIFLIRRLNLPTSYITIIILLFLFVWILLIYKLREAYFNSFRSNIQNSLSGDDTKKRELKKESTVSTAIRILRSENEKDILNLLDRINDIRLKSLKIHIIQLLKHPSEAVVSAAISQLYSYDRGTAVAQVRSLITSKNDEIVFAAMQYLLLHTDLTGDKIFHSYLDHPSDYIANAALLCLAKEAVDNPKIAEKYQLTHRVEVKVNELSLPESDHRKQEIAEILITIGYTGLPKYYSFISAHLYNVDPYITRHAIRAAGLTQDERFVTSLMDFLSEDDFNEVAIEALKNYGGEITKTILRLDQSEGLKDNVRQYIPKVVQSFKTRSSIKVLLRLLGSKDILIRLEATKSLNRLQQDPNRLRLDQKKITRFILKESKYYKNTIRAIATLQNAIGKEDTSRDYDSLTELNIARENLVEILQVQLDQGLQCIFKLLSLKYDHSDIEVAYYGLISDHKEAKVNAVEFLDNLLHAKLKNAMLSLIEYHVIESDQYLHTSSGTHIISESTCISNLMKNRGKKVKLAVLYLIRQLQEPRYITYLKPYRKQKNREVQKALDATIAYLSTL